MFDYSYTVAYISAKETSIFSKEALSRMSAEKGDAIRLLSQSGYGGGEAESVGALVDRELSSLRSFIMGCMPEALYSLLILPYDAHNLKVLLKCAVNGADASPYLYDNTMYDTEIAAACCRGGEFSLLSDNIAKILNPAYDEGILQLPLGISASCDRAFYTEIASRAKSAPKAIADYVRAETDGKNFISYFRSKRIGLDPKTFGDLLLPGGVTPCNVFTAAYASGAEDLKQYTFGLDVHDAFTAAAEAAKRSLSDANDVLDGYASSKLEPYKYEPQSVVPIFLYYKKKIAEARNIREAFSEGGAL